MNAPTLPAFSSDSEALQNRFALRVAARLSEDATAVSPDIAERLRFARERALQAGREVRQKSIAPATVAMSAGGAAILGGGSGTDSGWWVKLGSALPLIALIAGLVLIQRGHVNAQIATAAEIDAVLLADDLPPAAYGDAGFVEFLKAPRN